MLMKICLLNLIMTMLFIFLSHPLSMGLLLLIQTLLITLITGNFNLNYWFSYILFLILIGGMLILFIYMTSIASNEKFKFNFNLMIMFTLLTLLMINPNMMNFLIQLSMVNQEMIKLNNHWILNLSMNKIFNYPSSILLIFLIIYLFITLIAVVKITESKIGPLRQKN